MSFGKKTQDNWIARCQKLSSDVLISLKVSFLYNLGKVLICEQFCVSMKWKWTVHIKLVELLIEIPFPVTLHYPKAPVPVANNPIRSKIPWQNTVNFIVSPAGERQTGCLWWDLVQSGFYGDSESNFAFKNISMECLLGPTTQRINAIYKSWMK